MTFKQDPFGNIPPRPGSGHSIHSGHGGGGGHGNDHNSSFEVDPTPAHATDLSLSKLKTSDMAGIAGVYNYYQCL